MQKDKPKRKAAVKARRGWAVNDGTKFIEWCRVEWSDDTQYKAAVLCIDDPEALIEQVAKVLYNDDMTWNNLPEHNAPWMHEARRVLESLGILPKPRKLPLSGKRKGAK